MTDYHNITRAISFFEKPEWPSEIGSDSWKIRDAYLSAEDPIAKIDAGFDERVSALNVLRDDLKSLELPAEARAIVEDELSKLDELFGQYRNYPEAQIAKGWISEDRRWNAEPTERWFYKIAMPNTVIVNAGQEARAKLDQIRMRLFEEANKAS